LFDKAASQDGPAERSILHVIIRQGARHLEHPSKSEVAMTARTDLEVEAVRFVVVMFDGVEVLVAGLLMAVVDLIKHDGNLDLTIDLFQVETKFQKMMRRNSY
jgi:hypothetical protein